MYEFLQDTNFLEARKNRNCFLFEKVLMDVPTWNDVLMNIEKSVEEGSRVRFIPDFTIITSKGESHIKQAFNFLQQLKKLEESLDASAHVYIGLNKFAKSFGKHRDNSEVFFWQVIGSTTWKIQTSYALKEYTLEVGDVIYVPTFMEHEVTSLGPRVGISFGLDY